MIVCDDKHPKPEEGSRSLQVRGETTIGEEAIRFDLRIQVVKKDLCREHMLERLAKMDFVKLAKEGKKEPAKK